MTTSRADLLAGMDMEGGEGFCDSVYNFLKNQGKDINLITNSGFGVWSQSDANKGLASLPYTTGNGVAPPSVGDAVVGGVSTATGKVISYTTTGGDWTLGTAVGVVTLGAVTGTYQTGEAITFGGVETAVVGVDTDIGVKNDPMNNDSIAAVWTQDANMTLAFLAAEYSVNTTAINQHAWIVAAPLTAGKIYKIELDIKDGNVSDDIQGYFHDGAAQYGRLRTTAVGWASVAWVFECATTTAAGLVGFRVPANLGGGNTIQIRRFSCYEITPCCTATDALAFDGWEKEPTIDIYRQHNDGGTLTKNGSFYSLKMVPTAVGVYVVFPFGISLNEEWYQQFAGRPITIGAWIKTSTASHARIRIHDGANSYSLYHTGGGSWEWREITTTISATVTNFNVGIFCSVAPNTDGTTIVYISQPMLVLSSSIGEGQYQPRLQEEILTKKKIPSNLLNGQLSLSDVGVAGLNLEADSDAMIGKGCKAIKILTQCNDAASAGTDCYLRFRADVVKDYEYYNSPYGLVNDKDNRILGWQMCDVNGDIDYNINEAGGASGFDIDEMVYVAVQVN